MIFFFHHYELPAILNRDTHVAPDGQFIEAELELEILNPQAQRNNPRNGNTDDGINNTADDPGRNPNQDVNDLNTETRTSISNISISNDEALHGILHSPSNSEVMTNISQTTYQTTNIDPTLDNAENRTS